MAIQPIGRKLHRVARPLLTENVRVIGMGDSFMVSHLAARLFYGLMLTLPLRTKITGICTGWINGPNAFLTASDHVTAGSGSSRPLGGSDWEVNAGSGNYFALPVNQIAEWLGAADNVLDDNRICSLGIKNAGFTAGDHGAFTEAGDKLRVRPLIHATDNRGNLPVRVELWEHATASEGAKLSNATLRANCRPHWQDGANPETGDAVSAIHDHINAIHRDEEVVITNDIATTPLLVIRQNGTTFEASGPVFPLAGACFWKVEDDNTTRVPGQYWCSLASASFSHDGFGDDTESTSNSKNFSDEQFARWLDVTTLDRDQKVVYPIYFATENKTVAQVKTSFNAIRTKVREAHAAIGLTHDPLFLLISPHAHIVGAQSVADSKTDIEAETEAFFQLAIDNDDTAALSIYNMTDGTLFATDAVGGAGTQAASRQWLDANGYGTVMYGSTEADLSGAGGLNGDLLDASGLHPDDIGTAALLGTLVGEALEAALQPNAAGRLNRSGRTTRTSR